LRNGLDRKGGKRGGNRIILFVYRKVKLSPAGKKRTLGGPLGKLPRGQIVRKDKIVKGALAGQADSKRKELP